MSASGSFSHVAPGEFNPWTLATAEPMPLPALSPDERKRCVDALAYFKSKLSSRRGLADEFARLQATTRLTEVEMKEKCVVARKRGNTMKNRYTDVIPFDSTLVSLLSTTETSTDGYINASFVKSGSANGASVFIATQGPLPNTLNDFWGMVYLHQVPAIVMLTHFDRPEMMGKCANYLPPESVCRDYGNVNVMVKSKLSTSSSLELRCLELRHKEGGKPCVRVLHIQNSAWPDHGVPYETDAVRDILRRLYNLPSALGPLIVHCSAGIGRTGAYCTIHNTIQRIIAGDMSSLNIDRTVSEFRAQRAGMVQTMEQYIFIHRVIVEELEDFVSSSRK